MKITDYILSSSFKQDVINTRKKEYAFAYSYIQLIDTIWDKNGAIKATTFINTLIKLVPNYSVSIQQDSHECLIYILDLLHTGLAYEIEIDIQGNVLNETDRLTKLYYEKWKSCYEKEYSIIANCFDGMFLETVKCSNCNETQQIFNQFNNISLDIENDNLSDCLTDYFKQVLINSWTCEKCKCIGCKKNVSIWNAPSHLIINLKRFTFDGKKNNKNVNFVLDDLNLTNFISIDKNDKNNYIYMCYAINYHYGNTSGGHYMSACKNLDSSWYLYDDGNVHVLNENDNLTKDAYNIFYVRKSVNL